MSDWVFLDSQDIYEWILLLWLGVVGVVKCGMIESMPEGWIDLKI